MELLAVSSGSCRWSLHRRGPRYLTHKAQSIGYHPEIILAGRRLNDNMGAYVVSQLVKAMLKRRIHVDGARVLVMGLPLKTELPRYT